ncbi:MAG: hypothetical protein AAF468_14795 [Pseudomonadota bacterium]
MTTQSIRINQLTAKPEAGLAVDPIAAILRTALLTFLALFLAVTTTSLTAVPKAEAGVSKKVKLVGKGFSKLEKAGRKLSRKKGVVGKVGKVMRGTGRAGRKSARKLRRGMKKGGRFVNRQLGKSRAGRGVRKAVRTYRKARKSTINRAFKRCRTEACNDIRDVADAAIPG